MILTPCFLYWFNILFLKPCSLHHYSQKCQLLAKYVTSCAFNEKEKSSDDSFDESVGQRFSSGYFFLFSNHRMAFGLKIILLEAKVFGLS